MAAGGQDPAENPFSFKKFVNKKGSPTDENEPGGRPGGGDDRCSDTDPVAAAETGGKGVKGAEGWSPIT